MGNPKLQFGLDICSFRLPGFQILARSLTYTCLMPLCCFFSSSWSAPLLLPKKTRIIYWFKFKNLTSTSQAGIESYVLPLNVKLYSLFLMAKNLAINHLLLEALPAVQTWTPNCKRDCKTVVTWHSQVYGLQFPMKNLMLKVSIMYNLATWMSYLVLFLAELKFRTYLWCRWSFASFSCTVRVSDKRVATSIAPPSFLPVWAPDTLKR